jgi:HEAT repeat protein
MTVFPATVLCLALTLLGIGQDRSTGPTNQPPTQGGKTLDEWLRRLDSKDRRVRLEALIAIARFEDDAYKAVPVLLKQLKADDPEIRARTVTALGLVGRGDQGEFKPLINALKDRAPRVR